MRKSAIVVSVFLELFRQRTAKDRYNMKSFIINSFSSWLEQ